MAFRPRLKRFDRPARANNISAWTPLLGITIIDLGTLDTVLIVLKKTYAWDSRGRVSGIKGASDLGRDLPSICSEYSPIPQC